jgi:Rod binding domain-containing protein
MEPTSLRAVPAGLPLERLDRHPGLTRAQKVREASRQFEAVLVRQILQDAQKPLIASRFHSSSFAQSVYQDLVSAQLAEDISRSGALGLSRLVERQLDRPASPGTASEPT